MTMPEHGLLICALHRHETHAGASHRLADRLCIGGVGLTAFHVGLHVGGRYQLDGVTELRELPRPVVRRRARFNADQVGLVPLHRGFDELALAWS